MADHDQDMGWTHNEVTNGYQKGRSAGSRLLLPSHSDMSNPGFRAGYESKKAEFGMSSPASTHGAGGGLLVFWLLAEAAVKLVGRVQDVFYPVAKHPVYNAQPTKLRSSSRASVLGKGLTFALAVFVAGQINANMVKSDVQSAFMKAHAAVTKKTIKTPAEVVNLFSDSYPNSLRVFLYNLTAPTFPLPSKGVLKDAIDAMEGRYTTDKRVKEDTTYWGTFIDVTKHEKVHFPLRGIAVSGKSKRAGIALARTIQKVGYDLGHKVREAAEKAKHRDAAKRVAKKPNNVKTQKLITYQVPKR